MFKIHFGFIPIMTYHPTVSLKGFGNHLKKKARTFLRLKSNCIRLNKQLFKMKLQKDGLCNIWHKPEDVSHLLLDCHRGKGHDRYKAKITLQIYN